MRIKHPVIVLCLVSIGLSILACQAAGQAFEPADTPAPLSTDTRAPTATPPPTNTPAPTDTPEPTQTPASTDTPTPAASPTRAADLAATATQTAGDAHGVCVGKTLPQAAAYKSGPGPHPFLAFGEAFAVSDVRNEYSYNFPLDTWLGSFTYGLFVPAFADFQTAKYVPQGVEQLQLVVCLAYDRVLVETCTFTNGGSTANVRRMKDVLKVEVREAQKGTVVDSFEMTGGLPDACPAKADEEYLKYDVKVGAAIDTTALYKKLLATLGQ
jgi:hypothetical protein